MVLSESDSVSWHAKHPYVSPPKEGIQVHTYPKNHKNPGMSYRSPGLHLVSNPIVFRWDLNTKRPIRSRGIRILRGRYLHSLYEDIYIYTCFLVYHLLGLKVDGSFLLSFTDTYTIDDMYIPQQKLT